METKLYRYPTALTIAGSDSSGGAGIQADLKTFSSLGVYGASAITAITAQNTRGVRSIQPIDTSVFKDQIDMVFEDLYIDAVKTGMIHNDKAAEITAQAIRQYQPLHLVVDPVMVSTSGTKLIEDSTIEIIKHTLFPLASVITPNICEAELLSGTTISSIADMQETAQKLLSFECKSVLLKGGHLSGNRMVDVFIDNEGNTAMFESELCNTNNTHGTGCTLSSAITANLAKGHALTEAIHLAKTYISAAIQNGADTFAGHGHGAVNHFFAPQPLHKVKL